MKRRFLPMLLSIATALSLLPAPALGAELEITWLAEDAFEHSGDFHGGLAVVFDGWWNDPEGTRYGVVDASGKLVVTPSDAYQLIEDFHDGRAIVSTDKGMDGIARIGEKYGVIDANGKLLVPMSYDKIEDYAEGMAVVKKALSGKSPAGLTNEWEMGYLDLDGELAVPMKYGDAGDFSEGLALVADKDWNRGFIDKTGKEVIPLGEFDDLWDFREGLAYAKKGEKAGYINTDGEVVIPLEYDQAALEFSDGMAIVGMGELQERKFGAIDKTGTVIVPLEYEAMQDFHEGMAMFWENGKVGFVNKNGQVAIPAVYDDAELFDGGLCVVTKDGQRGVADRSGRLVVPLGAYEYVKLAQGMVIASDIETMKGEEHYGMYISHVSLLDADGQVVIPADRYDAIYSVGEGLFQVEAGNIGTPEYQTGLIDRAGNVVIPLGELEGISDFSEGLAWVVGDGKYGILKNPLPPEERQAPDLGELPAPYVEPAQPDPAETIPAAGLAYASTQFVLVDGQNVEFQCYALKDASGNDTNYIKLRDVASVLNGTGVQFDVGWNGAVNIETGKAYAPNGSEMSTPFSGDRAYEAASAPTNIDGQRAALGAIVLKDDQGGAFTYYKLRDLGTALGFAVDWSAEKGIFIETK